MFDLKTKVLVVDDMMTMRKIVTKNLKEFGFTDILEAADGNLAWEQLTKAAPPVQLIISDWNMPNCSGLEFLKKIRTDAKYAKLPFIMLTAEAEASQVKEALVAGVTNYVIKPFTSDALKTKLEQTHKKVSSA
jgi:two-component system, chemotaxis family, chemotaxis protein CheY